jgi:hypothetical protein
MLLHIYKKECTISILLVSYDYVCIELSLFYTILLYDAPIIDHGVVTPMFHLDSPTKNNITMLDDIICSNASQLYPFMPTISFNTIHHPH